MQAGQRDEEQDQVGRRDDQVAMRKVHQPHDAEDKAQPGREERVETAEQDALEDGVDPDHAASPK